MSDKCTGIKFLSANKEWSHRVARQWGEQAASHMHFDDGFSIIATCGDSLVGLISISWQDLPGPITGVCEGYIDIIEVDAQFRRQGVAIRMLHLAAKRARQHGAYQLRAWSSEDKTEAISMWRRLGFGLCPADTHPRGQWVRGYFVTQVL